ncbi:hypothetical protein ACFSDD_07295 [Salipiger marinus]|uniref:hypothetical protein n=1 Tax=Salipiger marinus TaxID=555512 RepID=UPI001E4A66CC|nr:hypothetical protein [Salipiger manganoxidans]MCD1620637.1 hypothetical protein [Salipiger manganoxidans]MEB3420972.1 hypothetical protein [Salipiger manganoxidans]
MRADDDAAAKYRNYLPDQLLALPEDERSSSVPMMFSGAANLATSPAGDLVMQANLNTLMYDGFADYDGAKRAFQADLGEEATGKLTVWQIHSLGYRASRVNMTSVSFFPFDFGGTMSENVAFVKGTLEIIDEKIAYPINHVDIKCRRNEGTCEYRQIALTLPDENSWVQSYYVGEIADEIYRITRWEGQLIDAVPLNNSACRTNQLILNFETQEFFEVARNNTAGDCETMLGMTLPRLEKPRVSRIVDGREIISAEFRAISEETLTFYSSSFGRRVEEFVSQEREN